jgi:hypothetical protein
MGWFSEWVRLRLQKKTRSQRRNRTYRPTVAELETRVVPAGIASNLINHGGAVLGSANVDLVFYGSAWNNNTSLQSQIDTFARYLVNSPFMSVLSQYGISPANVAATIVVPDAVGSRVTTQQIQDTLTQDIANGTLPTADSNTLYFVVTPPNVSVRDNPFTRASFLGYHSSLFDSQGNQDAYAVVPYPGGTNPMDPGLTPFQSFTDTFSHELAEAVTDPFVDGQGNPSGWDDYTFDPTGDIFQGEVADLAENASTVYLNGYAVTQLWSNQADSVVAPAGATSTPTAAPLTVTAKPITALTGQASMSTVAVLGGSDATAANIGNLTATIDWGDGTAGNPDTSTGTVTTDSNGNVVVQGTHTYTSNGSFPITVTVTDGTNTASDSSTATVTTPSVLTVTARNITAQNGTAFTGTVAVLSGTDATAANTGNLTATIDWGDGTSGSPDASTGSVTTDANGNIIVQGSHTYTSNGSFPITVTVTDGTTMASDSSTATVTTPSTPGTVTVTGATIMAVTGQPFIATVATVSGLSIFNDNDFGFFHWPGHEHGVVAQIDWGDGTTPSMVRLYGPDAQGNFDVVGMHEYAAKGDYTITITLLNRETETQIASGTASVNVADSGSLSVTGQRIETTAGTSFTGTIATITDPSAGNLTAAVDWGDGSPLDNTAQVTRDSNGNLIVVGTHTYSNVGDYHITVTVNDTSNGDRGEAVSLADVDRAPPTTTGHVRVESVDLNATAGQSFTDAIAVVHAPGASASTLTVSVNWGDGTAADTTNVQVLPFGTHGAFIITGTHTYAASGQYTVTVTVTDSTSGAQASSTSTANVTAAPATPPTTTTPTLSIDRPTTPSTTLTTPTPTTPPGPPTTCTSTTTTTSSPPTDTTSATLTDTGPTTAPTTTPAHRVLHRSALQRHAKRRHR